MAEVEEADDRLSVRIRDLGLSVRARKACHRRDILTLGDLARSTAETFRTAKNCGAVTLKEIRDKLREYGLGFADDIARTPKVHPEGNCGECGKLKRLTHEHPHQKEKGLVCGYCENRLTRPQGNCPGCNELKPLDYRHPTDKSKGLVCRRCYKRLRPKTH